MRRSLLSPLSLLLAAFNLVSFASAIRLIESKSLNPCQANSSFSATLFDVVFTPDNHTLSFNIVGVSAISGNVTADIKVIAYGFSVMSQTLDPCSSADLKGLCPMNTGQINILSNLDVGEDAVKAIPNIAYTVPDLDGKVQIYINDTQTKRPLACVEAELSNGQTVYHRSIGWATAVIAGLGLVASAITSGLGHSNTAAHVAANALSLFGYFQAQAFIGMTSVELPPIVASWTQNFQWSMGIIRVTFLQKMCTWYQRATGGTPTEYLSNLATTSVQVQKRSLDYMHNLYKRAFDQLASRSNNAVTNAETSQTVVLKGIERVGFRAKIETTNIFLTGYSFFIIFVIFIVLGVAIFKGVVELLAKSGKMKSDKFQDFRNGWLTVLKGILFRIVLIGFPQMAVLCFWELTKRDSPAEVVLAIFTIVTMVCILGWASSKVIRIAQRSIQMHKNPAYILYSDPVSLNKWGFLYVQFKATAYYFIVPVLFYVLIKGMFIGLSQGSGAVQAVALVLLEAALLVAVSILRPYMDKKTNGFNIAIAAINFLGAIFVLVFSEVFNQPGIVTGVMGVIFFVFNAVFSLILLLMVLVSSVMALLSKNPDTRYQPMRDDRGSFIKSQTQLTTELDALGATARGEGKGYRSRTGIDDDEDNSSLSSGSNQFNNDKAAGINTPGLAAGQGYSHQSPYGNPPRSPVEAPSQPFLGGGGAPPAYYSDRHNSNSPSQYSANPYQNSRSGSISSQSRRQQNASPAPNMWNRGVGFDH